MGFTPCKKKKHKKIKAYRKSVKKEFTFKRRLLILEMKPYIIVQRKAFYRQRMSPAVRTKKLLTETFLQHLGMMTEKSCNLSE